MAQSFCLIDLFSQRKALREYLQNFTEEELLAWLRSHGNLREIPETNPQGYSFTSTLGIEHAFFFGHGRMRFVLDDYLVVS